MYVELSENDFFFTLVFGGSKGGARDAPGIQILSFLCSFRQKNLKNIALLGADAPPPPGKSWIAAVSGEKIMKKWRRKIMSSEERLKISKKTI